MVVTKYLLLAGLLTLRAVSAAAVMILVLTDGDRRVWIDVVLKDGCEVRVGNQTVDCSNVEPVPWYKVRQRTSCTEVD